MGVEGSKLKKHSKEFKLNAVEDVLKYQMGLRETTRKYGVASFPTRDQKKQDLGKEILCTQEIYSVFGWKKIRETILQIHLNDRKFKGNTLNPKRIQGIMNKCKNSQ